MEKRKAEPRTTNENTKELIAITVDLQKVYWLGYLMVGSKVSHIKVHQILEERIEQVVSTIYDNTNESIEIIIDLQRVHLMDCLTDCLMGCLMGCLMVGSKVLHKKVRHRIEEQIEDKVLVI